MIKAIIFDCFGVLTADSWHEFRLSLDPALQSQASELNHRYCANSMTREEFLSSVASLTGASKEKIAGIIDNETDKNYELLNYIAELKKSGYKIGLLSNVASNYIREVLLTAAEQKLFDSFVFSYEVGMIKPDPRIYHLAREKLGVGPEQCVFVDDIERLSMAAEKTGMKAIVYRNFHQLKAELQVLLANPYN